MVEIEIRFKKNELRLKLWMREGFFPEKVPDPTVPENIEVTQWQRSISYVETCR